MTKKGKLFIIFFALMCLGLFLRTYHISNFGLFGDEKQSVLIAVGNTNFGGMSKLMNPPAVFSPADYWAPRGIQAWFDADARGDVSGNSLVHDMMLKFVANVFGKGDGTLRGVSVFFNMLTLWLLFYWARRQKKQEFYWPLGILFLAVLEPFFVVFSQQARNYTTSLFFSTASNYFFWKIIIQKADFETPKPKDILGWAIASLLALFSTYLTALVLIGQLIYMLIRRPTWIIWQKMLLAAILIVIPFGIWMLWGPGQYFLAYQADAGKQYLTFLQTNGPIKDWIEAASPGNLIKRTISIVSDNFFWTNDLYARQGIKFGGILLMIFGFFVVRWVKNIEDLPMKRLFTFAGIQIFFPVLVLILTALQAGTTTGFFLRYASFAIPFGIFISAGFADYLLRLPIWYRSLGILLMLIQLYFLVSQFTPLYKDQKQKYTNATGRIRERNPYPLIADRIRTNYSLGDTVLFPSRRTNFLNSQHIDMQSVDVSDAQLVNLYFDADEPIFQKIDTTYQDSVIIQKKNGQRLLIFDFRKGSLRY
jgi:hypothetical protein